jgi:hypothetical protein
MLGADESAKAGNPSVIRAASTAWGRELLAGVRGLLAPPGVMDMWKGYFEKAWIAAASSSFTSKTV